MLIFCRFVLLLCYFQIQPFTFFYCVYKHVSTCVFVSDCAEVYLFAHTSFDQRLLSLEHYLTIQHISELRLHKYWHSSFLWMTRQLEQMHKQVTAYYGCEIQKQGRTGEARPRPARPKMAICLKETQDFETHPPSLMRLILYKDFALTVMRNSTQI